MEKYIWGTKRPEFMTMHQEVGRKPEGVALGLRTEELERVRIVLAERKYLKPQSTECSCFLDMPSDVMEIPLTFSMQG